jgi:enoyl-CoA hydratase
MLLHVHVNAATASWTLPGTLVPCTLLTTVDCARRGSPLSQKVTLQMLRQAKDRPLSMCLQMDYRIVSRMVCGPSDFWEGVRATLIDKDRNPAWLEPDLRKARFMHVVS